MALTKIGSIGINTGIAFAGVTTIATLNGSDSVLSVGGTVNFVSDVSIGGTVSIAGTLTYEDVTNVDAVGLITARDGIKVGSGITLSVDGDIFATGVVTATTFSGAFSGDGSALTGVANTDVIFTDKLSLPDSSVGSINVGLGSDLQVYHTGTHSFIENKVGNLRFKNDGTYKGAQFEVDLIDFNTSDNSVVHMRKEPKGNINITKNLNVVGTVTATSYTGDGSALTGIGGTDFIHAEQVNVSGITTSQAFVPTTGQLSHRNLIINGAMNLAQRATSSTNQGYSTVDRITPYTDNIGVTPTYSQVDVASGTTPYSLGFRKAFQITKGAGTANAASQVNIGYKIEAQDMATSGWNYTDTSSFITLSFWVKTSVSNHNPQVLIQNSDTGTSSTKFFVIDVPTLTANTWTKITQTIPGHANQVYNNDNGTGLEIQFIPWYGTDYTDSGNTTGAWTSFGTKPVDSTWLTTNSSTFQITGIQLEVGPVATPFEHRSHGDNLAACQRYFYQVKGTDNNIIAFGFAQSSSNNFFNIEFPQSMRDYPTFTGSATAARFYSANNGQDFNLDSLSINSNSSHPYPNRVTLYVNQGGTSGGYGGALTPQNAEGTLSFSAEL